MFDQPLDIRLSKWLEFRRRLDKSKNPLQDVHSFWSQAPFIPYNKNIDPYNKLSWPSPWEIIEYNKYDDFTKALMISWTLKLSEKFKLTDIELHTVVDNSRQREYNLVYVDNENVLNYSDTGPIDVEFIPGSFNLKNMVQIQSLG
ncbi:MAG: hypothetical protein EBU90_07910 [Proteobacteria bacterium]|nr:hypothetical protein [Pseudomonadota bacterium]NBP14125.1 hypothetical protein [bacterium]